MSLKNFIEGVRSDVVGMQAKGFKVTGFVCCPEGQTVLVRAMEVEANMDATPVPLTLFSRPIKVDPRMPKGHMWYVLRGGKE